MKKVLISLIGTIALAVNVFADYKTITVTLDANGGSGGTTRYLYCEGEYDYDEHEWWYGYVNLGELPTPTRDGWFFVGWWTEPTGGYRVSYGKRRGDYNYYNWNIMTTTLEYDASCYENIIYCPENSIHVRSICTRGNVRLYAHWAKSVSATDLYSWDAEHQQIWGMWLSPSGSLEIPSRINGRTVMRFGHSPCMPEDLGYGPNGFDFTHVTSFTLPNTIIFLDCYDFEGSMWWNNQSGPVARIGEWAVGLKDFTGTKLVIPAGVKKIACNFAAVWTGHNVPLLQSVQFPDGLSQIVEQAFCYQIKLKNVHIPATVEYIGVNAFSDVPGPFYFHGNRPKIDDCGGYRDAEYDDYGFERGQIVYFKANTTGWKDGGRWGEAIMKKWPTVKISFNANGGKCSTRTRKYYKTDTYSVLPRPTRTGYTFVGWYSKKSGGSKVTEASKVPSAATTLYAHWKLARYSVELSDIWNNSWGSVSRTHGSKVGTLPVPSMNGYKFLGWYTAAQGGSKVSAKAKVTRPVTYYAHWTPAYAFKGRVVSQGGAKGRVTLSEKDGKVKVGGTATLTAKVQNTNSLFAYWEDADGNIVSYSATLKVKPTGDVSYSAVFRTKAACATPAFDGIEPYGVNGHASANNMVGVGFNAQVTVNEEAYPVKFTAKGLPPGLKINAMTGAISGVPTKAGTFTAIITATSVANAKKKASKRMPFVIDSLPARARGGFKGVVRRYGKIVGSAALSVGVNGKMSGKIVAGGQNWVFAASGYSSASDSQNDRFVVSGTATCKVGKTTSKQSWKFELVPPKGDVANTIAVGNIGDTLRFEAQRNFWADTGAAALLANWIGAYDWYTENGEKLKLTLDANGNVKIVGTLANGRKLSLTTPLWYNDDGSYGLLVYAPKQTVTIKSGNKQVKRTYQEFIALPDFIPSAKFDLPSYNEVQSRDSVQLWEGGPYWATTNIGANEPWESGYYFWWGDTVGYARSGGTWNDYGNGDGSGYYSGVTWMSSSGQHYYSGVTWVSSSGQQMSSSPFSSSSCPTGYKDNSALLSAGYIDSTGNLVAVHDAATAYLGAPWRMPTDAEFSALISNCTSTWITTNGVSGRLVTGKGSYANRSIFLPAAGYGDDSYLVDSGSIGYYWSSTPDSVDSNCAWYRYFNSSYFFRGIYHYRYFGQSVRPVRDDGGAVNTYTVTYDPGLNGSGPQQTATKTYGMALTLKGAIFTRSGYTQTGWAMSDGGMKAYDLGASYMVNAAITLYPYWTADSGSDARDGVLLWEGGPYWATTNIGADEPWESGYYFWWGDTVGYTNTGSGWISVKDGTSISFSTSGTAASTYNKDNSALLSAGYIDSTGNLVATHDAATAYLGAPWRMPTDAEIVALISNCTTTWITTNGVYGRLVTGKGAYANRSIFLPAAGYGDCSNLSYPGLDGRYWSSTPEAGYSNYAWGLRSSSSYFCRYNNYRFYGQSIRPVRGFAE